MKRLFVLVALCLIAAPYTLSQAAENSVRLVLTGSRVTESLVPNGSADLVLPGGLATYSLVIEQDGGEERALDAYVTLPPGQRYLSGTLRINGLPPAAGLVSQTAGLQLGWQGLRLPGARAAAQGNLAGIHIFLPRQPSNAEIDRRLNWARQLVGPGGSVKLFLDSLTERDTEPPAWAVYAVRRCYELGLRPVVRLGFANGDTSSFTRRWDDPVGQMRRDDAADGYWRIGWAARSVVAGLLAATDEASAAAQAPELTVIVGNEPNLEWIERDWFIDYTYVRREDGSFDTNWLTTDPNDPTAAANSPLGWRVFVRGLPGTDGSPATYETRLDDYVRYMGYDAAVEYGRFLRTTSGLLRELDDGRLRIAAGAIASGGGDLEARYAYHQRHFIRRMLRSLPDALSQVDLWTTNNYPYTLPPTNNYHSNPADFERHPLGEPFWHTEIGIDSYRGDLDYLRYLRRKGMAGSVPEQAIIGEVGYGIGHGWGTDFGHTPISEDLRAAYLADIFERYYNGWSEELAGVNLWQLGDPDPERPTFHMFDFVYPDSEDAAGWPTHRHLMYDAVAARSSRPGPGRLIITFQVQLDADAPAGTASAFAAAGGASASYRLMVVAPQTQRASSKR